MYNAFIEIRYESYHRIQSFPSGTRVFYVSFTSRSVVFGRQIFSTSDYTGSTYLDGIQSTLSIPFGPGTYFDFLTVVKVHAHLVNRNLKVVSTPGK